MTEKRSRPRLLRRQSTLSPSGGVDPSWLDAVVAEEEELEVLAHPKGLLVAAAPAESSTPWLACDLQAASVPELVALIAGARLTGALDVVDARSRRKLFFEKGGYTGAMSGHADDRLGEVIWREGRISLDQLVIASESLEKGKRIGRHLVDLGYLEPRELRGFLRKQAEATFLAACLEHEGHAVFVAGPRHLNPVRFAGQTEVMLDHALEIWDECRKLQRELEPMSALAKPVVPPPPGPRSEAQEAMLQLATSAKVALTRRGLLERAGLGRLHGLRALASLYRAGYFERGEEEKKPITPSATRHERLCAAINHVMDALREAGGGTGPVREYLKDPPEHLADVLSGIQLDERLEPEQLDLQASFASGGKEAMESALLMLLDFALFEARDTLELDVVSSLQERVSALEVF